MADHVLMKGNEAMAEAAIIAGCRHYYAYPITPQNEVVAYMAEHMPRVNGTFIQAESELAAASMVLGSAAAGVRSMTSSSSPGISLKQEAISYMAGAEIPCVIANIMRGGPGLGGISGAQSDYFQATRGGGHGDYRTIVLAPGNAQELADFTVHAFDLADEYRIPVIVLADGYLGQMSEPVILPQPSGKKFEKPWIVNGAKGRRKNVVASLLLKPDGALEKHNLNLQEKYTRITENVRRFDTHHADDADWLIVAYGTAARVAEKAVDKLRERGMKAGLFRPTSLWPFPDRELFEVTQHCKRVLAVEMSHGQMVEDVQLAINGEVEVDFYGRAGGVILPVQDIMLRIEKYEQEKFTHIQAS